MRHVLTNIDVAVLYAYRGLQRQRQRSLSTPLSMKLPYYGLAAVGILSGLFHMVLNFHSQMGSCFILF